MWKRMWQVTSYKLHASASTSLNGGQLAGGYVIEGTAGGRRTSRRVLFGFTDGKQKDVFGRFHACVQRVPRHESRLEARGPEARRSSG